MQKVNLRLVAFLLLLAFFQKMGLELWLHHWLHDPPAVHSAGAIDIHPGTPGEKDRAFLQQLPVKCSCLDDTMMPLIGSVAYVYKAPAKQPIAFLPTPYSSALSNDKVFPALRGPPAASFLL